MDVFISLAGMALIFLVGMIYAHYSQKEEWEDLQERVCLNCGRVTVRWKPTCPYCKEDDPYESEQ